MLKFLGGLVLLLLLLIGGFFWLASTRPMVASSLAWPLVEWYALDEFKGVTTDGVVQGNLFSIADTGVSNGEVVRAAKQFLQGLTAAQRVKTLHAVDDLEWRRWANIHLSTRRGVGLLEMDAEQKALAFDLMRASLSARGFQTAQDIMKLEGHLADLLDNYVEYGEERYWFTVMGEPSESEPWGWQLDGHHLIVNFFVLGSQVVMTPTFMGSEPTRADTGRFAGTVILQEETDLALQFVNALSDEQRALAIVEARKTGNNNYGELFSDNVVVPEQGLGLATLDAAQKTLAVELISLYTGQMRDAQAAVKLEEIMAHWDNTRFAWIGDTGPEAVFYYRIQSPVVLIEFDHQGPIALDGPRVPSRNHIHTVVRTPNGNDYGKDLLRQHLAQHPH